MASEMKIKALVPWLSRRVEVRPDTQCWIWQQCKNRKGYGISGVRGIGERFAHRIAYRIHAGLIPGNLCVLHRCDTPACCNPDHLFLGTRADNNRDMMRKRRNRKGGSKTPLMRCSYERGERHHAAKLTVVQVLQIRRKYASGGYSYSTLAREFSAKPHAIGKIIRRERWDHI